MNRDNQTVLHTTQEMTLKDFILLLKKWFGYLLKQWKILLLALSIGALLGFLKVYLTKPVFKASTSFVLDEGAGKNRATGGLAMLGLAGDGEGGSDLFHGDNLKWLYTTRSMLQRTLLTPVVKGGKSELLIDRFKKEQKAAIDLLDKYPELKKAHFSAADADNTDDPLKNQVINAFAAILKGQCIKVKDVDKTEGVIEVTVLTDNETLSMDLGKVLVSTVNDFYIKTKTKKSQDRVTELQHSVDKINASVNKSMYQTATSIDNVPYANPNRQVAAVPARRTGIDVEVNTKLYAQAVAELDMAKADLLKATPIVQVVEAPVYPLPIEAPSRLVWVLIGAIGLTFVTAAILLIRKLIRETLAS